MSMPVSMVDGFNLPMEITFANGVNCSSAGCPVDLVANCECIPNGEQSQGSVSNSACTLGPDQLKGPFDSNGSAVGCKSACDANLDGNPSKQHILATESTSTIDMLVV